MINKIIYGNVPTTDALINGDQLKAHVGMALDKIAEGGVAIFPTDLAYGIAGFQSDAIKKIFSAKQRSLSKPCGMFGSWQLSEEIHALPGEKHAMIRELISVDNLPLAIVASVNMKHPMIRAASPETIALSSKDGTMDMVMNGGFWHEELVRQSLERGMPVFGSSANQSETGSKYRLGDIESRVLESADICFDYGVSRYSCDSGISSTVIDMENLRVIRKGHRYDEISEVFRQRFGIQLAADDN